MTASQFSDLLLSLRACTEAKAWATGKDLATVWETCPRGDWLLWLCGKMADKPGWPTRHAVVLAACACAKTALKYVPNTEDRPRKCLEVVRAWARGEASISDVRKARAAAAYAAATDAAYAAAAYAAAYAAATDAADAAAYAAADAAYAAADAAATDAAAAAAYAAVYAAREKAQRECADIVRREMHPEAVAK